MFVIEQQRLAKHCQFGQTLDGMLQDQLVCGIADGRVQHWFLTKPKLTLKKALELAQTQETAEKGVQQLQQQCPQASQLHAIGQTKRSNHHQINARQEQQREQCPCYCCGRTHSTATCWFKDAIWYKYNKKGYYAKVCPVLQKANPEPRVSDNSSNSCGWWLCECMICLNHMNSLTSRRRAPSQW